MDAGNIAQWVAAVVAIAAVLVNTRAMLKNAFVNQVTILDRVRERIQKSGEALEAQQDRTTATYKALHRTFLNEHEWLAYLVDRRGICLDLVGGQMKQHLLTTWKRHEDFVATERREDDQFCMHFEKLAKRLVVPDLEDDPCCRRD
jgi:hypothetical protein